MWFAPAFVALLITTGDHVDHPSLHALIGILSERRPHSILGDLAKGVRLDIDDEDHSRAVVGAVIARRSVLVLGESNFAVDLREWDFRFLAASQVSRRKLLRRGVARASRLASLAENWRRARVHSGAEAPFFVVDRADDDVAMHMQVRETLPAALGARELLMSRLASRSFNWLLFRVVVSFVAVSQVEVGDRPGPVGSQYARIECGRHIIFGSGIREDEAGVSGSEARGVGRWLILADRASADRWS